MCGITGIFAYRSGASDPVELRRMRDHMAARGPDGTGEWHDQERGVALGHRRLAIIDLSEAGAQPMASADGALVIVYNGEIYNYRELRRRLEGEGCVLRTHSDTEVLLELYARRGLDMLSELRGMFAFALWDRRQDRLVLVRDPFGIKPLYYADAEGCFRFASQVKALLQAPVSRAPSPAGHVGFFLWGSVPEPFTLYRDIRALPAGHVLTVGRDGAAVSRSYLDIGDALRNAADRPAPGNRAQAIATVAEAVHDSVRAHHVADVPVGVFLSAGLDSTLIASSAVRLGAPPHTITLGFDEFAGSANDEAPLAEALAHRLGARHRTLVASREDFQSERESLFAAMDQPSIDGVNTWFVSRAAAQLGMKVALSGLGGDELFGSYPSFRDVPGLVRKTRAFAATPRVGRALRAASAPVLRHLTSPKYAGVVEYGSSLGRAYLLRRCLFAPWELAGIVGAELAGQGLEELDSIARLEDATRALGSDRLAVSALEMQWYMRNQLLRDADWAGMAHSLEIRVPFLDLELLRRAAPCFAAHPDIAKAEIAAAVAPDLPASLLSRPKTGFVVPVRDWIRAPDAFGRQERGLRGWAREIHQRFAGDR